MPQQQSTRIRRDSRTFTQTPALDDERDRCFTIVMMTAVRKRGTDSAAGTCRHFDDEDCDYDDDRDGGDHACDESSK